MGVAVSEKSPGCKYQMLRPYGVAGFNMKKAVLGETGLLEACEDIVIKALSPELSVKGKGRQPRGGPARGSPAAPRARMRVAGSEGSASDSGCDSESSEGHPPLADNSSDKDEQYAQALRRQQGYRDAVRRLRSRRRPGSASEGTDGKGKRWDQRKRGG